MFLDKIKNFLNQKIKKKKTVELKKSEAVNSVILSLKKDRKDRIIKK
jgi:hypothetical protein